ncbi:unnamed protein product [Fusarium graminearum]|uniref:Uncharacterized protein n=1 Tax=Gibberella zeae TaxID=5518 RepID=A0A679NUV2_GIBZA|nr:hypothetical protein FG05_13317 [Fusarium graminearum]CAF3465039.1 unnamed protein product [Fusarium graminearum]CAF3498608.1 unnamed protein product [Fusarium graminearum]CAG1975434.1 unnamed protein product [Fusarium graminearum]CAG2010670.1 unnamed protein product [Fusarium graminearum]
MVFESQFQICTNLAGIANALARNYRQDGGAETSKRLRTPRSIHAIHPILMIKGLGNPENTTVIARGLVDEVLGSVGGWRERLQVDPQYASHMSDKVESNLAFKAGDAYGTNKAHSAVGKVLQRTLE